MTALTAQAAGRAAAEELMVDECRVRGAGSSVLDQTTGEYTVTPGPVVYEGPCRVRVPQAVPGSPDAGERVWSVTAAVISVPLHVTGVRVGHTVAVTSAAADPGLEQVTFRVDAVEAATYPTARRLRCRTVQD